MKLNRLNVGGGSLYSANGTTSVKQIPTPKNWSPHATFQIPVASLEQLQGSHTPSNAQQYIGRAMTPVMSQTFKKSANRLLSGGNRKMAPKILPSMSLLIETFSN